MPFQFDWKFVLTLVAAVAGVLVPVLLWQADLSAKSISLRVISVSELRPQGAAKLDGIQLSLDGNPIERPFVSVIELKSTGNRPIQSSDFEAPIEVFAKAPVALLKAQVTRVEPVDLEPLLTVGSDKVVVSPLLLNPGDQIQVTILTSGSTPEFGARSRIAGVSSLVIDNLDPSRMQPREWLRLITGTLLLVLYGNLMMEFLFGVRRRIFQPWHLAGAITACMGGVLLAKVSGTAGLHFSSYEWNVFAVAGGISFVILWIRQPWR